jgi:hypothetical protein
MRSIFLLALLAALAAVGIEMLTRRAYPAPAKVRSQVFRSDC